MGVKERVFILCVASFSFYMGVTFQDKADAPAHAAAASKVRPRAVFLTSGAIIENRARRGTRRAEPVQPQRHDCGYTAAARACQQGRPPPRQPVSRRCTRSAHAQAPL